MVRRIRFAGKKAGLGPSLNFGEDWVRIPIVWFKDVFSLAYEEDYEAEKVAVT